MTDDAQHLSPDPSRAWDFLKSLWPESSELVLSIEPRGGEPFGRRYTAQQGAEFTANLPAANLRLDTYFSVNLPRSVMNKKPKKRDIGTIRALFVDLDPAKGRPLDAERARIEAETTDEALAARGLPPPTARTYSGGGCWLFWALAEPITVPRWSSPDKPPEVVREVDGIGRRIASLFADGDSCHNIDRIARLPYTVNWASLSPRKTGRPDALASVDSMDPERRYALRDFPEPLYDNADAPGSGAGASARDEPPAEPDGDATLDDLPTEELRRVAEHGYDPENATRWAESGTLDKSDMLHWFNCECVRRGVPQATALAVVLGDFGIRCATKGKRPSPLVYAQRQWARASAKASRPADDFVRDENGAVLCCQANIREGLRELGVTVWWDDFADRMCIDGLDGFGPYVTDPAANRLRLRLDSTYGFLPSADLFNAVALDVAFDNRRNPVAEYLDGVQAAWDGKPRLDRVLVGYFGAEDSPLHRAIGAIVFTAAVRRVRQPGCKFDEILILESEQGRNKSSAWRALAVDDRWFTDDLPLGARTKEVLEVVEGVWIAELSELKGMRQGEVEAIKSFASRQEDRARMAYGRFTEYRPRRFIMVGSTNDRKYLKDRTGNRRFWPVASGFIDLERIRADRDQLWAEAATREAAGESIRLDPSLWEAAAAAQDDRAALSAYDERLAELIGHVEQGWVRTEDLWRVVGKLEAAHRSQADNEALAAAMIHLGWRRPPGKQIRCDGQRFTGFVCGPARVTASRLPRVTFERIVGPDGSQERGDWRATVQCLDLPDYGPLSGLGTDGFEGVMS